MLPKRNDFAVSLAYSSFDLHVAHCSLEIIVDSLEHWMVLYVKSTVGRWMENHTLGPPKLICSVAVAELDFAASVFFFFYFSLFI